MKRKMSMPSDQGAKRMALVPYVGIHANATRNQDGHLIPKSFAFEVADQKRKAKREAKLREIYEKEKALREFKARPIPMFSPKPVAKSLKRPTMAEPFELESVLRHEVYREKWEKQLKEEEKLAKERAKFIAGPCTATVTSPFLPNRSTKSLTKPFVKLYSEERGVARREYDEGVKALKKVCEDLERERDELRRREEELEMMKFRRTLVHKPLLLPVFPQLYKIESDKELTTPLSPEQGPRRNTL